jgi:hypothetical protein
MAGLLAGNKETWWSEASNGLTHKLELVRCEAGISILPSILRRALLEYLIVMDSG